MAWVQVQGRGTFVHVAALVVSVELTALSSKVAADAGGRGTSSVDGWYWQVGVKTWDGCSWLHASTELTSGTGTVDARETSVGEGW